MRRVLLSVSAAACLFGLLVGAVSAQDVVVDGLNNPRQLAYNAETGEVYVAEAGTGGSLAVQGNFGPAMAGSTAQISVIAPDGTVTTPVTGLPSRNEGGEVVGASGVWYGGGLLWAALGQGTLNNPLTYSVVAFDPSNAYRVVHFIDIYSAEAALNPDGAQIDSNPVDLAYDGTTGVLYIADAGGNCVWRWTEADGLSVFAAWETNPVPTSVAVAPDGIYVGFLTGFPFPAGGSTVEKYDADGNLIDSYEGFTTVVDLLFANDTLYAVEFAQFGEQGWTPETGRVVDVFSGAVYYEGLNLPYGLIMTDDSLMIAVNTAYMPDGSGAVLKLG
jgi:hypothetical protein